MSLLEILIVLLILLWLSGSLYFPLGGLIHLLVVVIVVLVLVRLLQGRGAL